MPEPRRREVCVRRSGVTPEPFRWVDPTPSLFGRRSRAWHEDQASSSAQKSWPALLPDRDHRQIKSRGSACVSTGRRPSELHYVTRTMVYKRTNVLSARYQKCLPISLGAYGGGSKVSPVWSSTIPSSERWNEQASCSKRYRWDALRSTDADAC